MSHLIKLLWSFFVSCQLWTLLLNMTIGAQDKPSAPVFPNHAPVDFNKVRQDVPKSNLETITYNSKGIGVDRKAVVYTPPNYDPDKKYPVLYLNIFSPGYLAAIFIRLKSNDKFYLFEKKCFNCL